MKILFICNQITILGGVERVLVNLCNDLCNKFEIYILQVKYYGFSSYLLDNRVKLENIDDAIYVSNNEEFQNYYKNYKKNEDNNFRMGVNKVIKTILPLGIYKKMLFKKNRKTTIQIEDKINNIKPDIVIDTTSIFSIFINKNINIISWEHNEYSAAGKLDKKFLKIRNSEYKKNSIVITLTKRDELIYKNNGINAITIPNYIYFNNTKNISLKNQNTRVISIGRLEKDKGFDDLVKIWSKVNEKKLKIRLDIFGDGSQKYFLEEMIKKEKVQDTLKIVGKSDRMIEEIEKSDILVLTSKHEGFSMVILEALACGVPVIAFDCNSGPREIINHNIDGELIKPGDINNFSERLLNIIQNNDLRKKYSENALKNSQRFSKEEIIKKWEEVLNNMILLTKTEKS